MRRSPKPNASSEYGNIFLSLDREVYVPGDTLRGRLYLQLAKPYPAEFIWIYAIGKAEIYAQFKD